MSIWALGTLRLHEAPDPIGLVHAALDRGATMLDCADVYGASPEHLGQAETLVASALASWEGDRNRITVATKGGLVREGKRWRHDGRAGHLRQAAEHSLQRLGRIDLYLLHAPDPGRDIRTAARAIAKLQKDGLVQRVGLCNVRVRDLEAAAEHIDLAAVQVRISPRHSEAIDGGVARWCLDRGVTLLAHSPFGGHKKHTKTGRHPVLLQVASRHPGARAYDVAFAWLRLLGAVPVVGCTRIESLPRDLELSAGDLAALDAAFPSGARLRTGPLPAPDPDTADGEVVLVLGPPAAGKSTRARAYTERGYARLNRDERGGTLADLLPVLDAGLAGGERRWVLDNTYASRAARAAVIGVAWSHGVPVRAEWLDTPIERAQVHAASRLLDTHGRLLEPDELRASKSPADFDPRAQFRWRRGFEPPSESEGLAEIRRLEPGPLPISGERAALIVDYPELIWARVPRDAQDIELVDGIAARLQQAARTRLLLSVAWLPAEDWPPDEARAVLEATHAALGVEILATWCPHPPGPPVCWCRKPLPGLGVYLTRLCGLDRTKTSVWCRNAADRGFAERCGFSVATPATP